MDFYVQALYQDPPPACPGGTIYVIQAGDTLYSLARRFGTSVQGIITANPGINPNALQIGMQICIPVAPVPATCPPGGIIYTIVSGDTIYAIARRYNVSVDAILGANPGINPNALYIGQQLCIPIPVPPPTITCPGPTYTIRPGDTLYNIARILGFTVEALLAANPGLDPNSLQVGRILCLPTGGLVPCPGGTIYRVRPGDTLAGIAIRFDIPLSRLMAANPQLSTAVYIYPGEAICIPIREI
jgi:peptidoglycan endopeptidase LytF